MESLGALYEATAKLKPLARARQVPNLLVRLLELQGYSATLNAKAAAPRDADLFVSSYDDDFLVEVKTGAKSVGIDVIDALHARLVDMAPQVVGLLFSRTTFSEKAIRRVQERRTRLILLVNGPETSELFSGRLSLRDLIRVKRRALQTDAQVAFVDQGQYPRWPAQADRGALPEANRRPFDDGGAARWTVTHGGHGDWVFVDEIPDVDWTVALGSGIGLDVDLHPHSLDDLAGIFEVLRRGGWISGRGRFAIHQTGISWHGAGAAEFLQALLEQSQRNATAAGAQLHNEEHAVYFDEYLGGLYTIVLRVLVRPTPRLMGCQLSLQLPGIPLDSTRLRVTMDLLGAQDDAWLRGLKRGDRLQREPAFAQGEVKVRILAESAATDAMTSNNETWIRSVVVDNPFRTKKNRGRAPASMGNMLLDTDALVCRVGDWYTTDRRPSRFYLSRVETLRTASAQIVSATVTWSNPAPLQPSKPRRA